jgi:hypothetical protein
MGRLVPLSVAALIALLMASAAALGQPSEVYGWAWVTVDQPAAWSAGAVEGGAGAGGVYPKGETYNGTVLFNLSYILNVHVRLLVGGQAYVPTFNVTYTVNGTQRVAVKGEDSLEYVRPANASSPTVALAFPSAVNGYTLVNSTTSTVALTGVNDVWVYYAGAQSGGGGGGGVSSPGQLSQPSQPSQPAQPTQPSQPQQPWFVWVVEWIAKWLERLWPWWLLLLLALVALLVYLWWRERKRFVLIIEV